MSIFAELKETVSRQLFPRRCPLCGGALGRSERICGGCSDELVPIKRPICETCGRQLFECGCSGEEYWFSRCVAPFVYTRSARRGVHRLKSVGSPETASFFGKRMAATVRQEYAGACIDLVTCIPMNNADYRRKGFNHSALLAREVAAELELESNCALLIKPQKNSIQHSLGRAERLENVNGVFRAARTNLIAGRTILLCDDVMTTGYTLSEAARVLLEAGARRVVCVVAASTSKELVSSTKRAMIR